MTEDRECRERLQEFKRLMFKRAQEEVEGPLPEDMMVVVGVCWEEELAELQRRDSMGC